VTNGSPTSINPKSNPPLKQADDDDDWGLSDFVSAPSTTKTPSPQPPSQPQSRTQSQSQSIWDLDEFTSPSASHSSASLPHDNPPAPPTIREPQPQARSHTPGDDFSFDFGDREDRLLGDDNDSHDEDDILGVLSKPVDAIRTSSVSLTFLVLSIKLNLRLFLR
jgi:hypothetical protein